MAYPEFLSRLVECLQWTLLPDKAKRQEGERTLKQMEVNKDFGQLLLHIIGAAGSDLHIRLAAAVALKNYVRKYWPDPDKSEDFEVPVGDRELLKKELVPMMYRVPQVIQKVIGETITMIAWLDFPGKWPTLLSDLTCKFNSGEIDAVLGSLRTAHGLFKHYRTAFESNGLWSEIKVVLSGFAPPFTELFLATLNRVPQLENLSREGGDQAAATETLRNAFQIILYCCKIYHSLITQDLPQVFEDHLYGWMQKFEILLKYENNDLRSDNDDEPGVLNNIKSEICDVLTLFASKYDDDFDPFVAGFVKAVIELLMKITQLMQDDSMAFSAMEFLSKTLAQNKCRDIFNQPEFLEGVCERIVVPNIQFRQSDGDDFEQNPEEFIRRDIEGSDMHTRRRAAADLVRAATKHHEERVTKHLISHIETLITEFQKEPKKNWKLKDAAIFLTAALAAKGQTARYGTTAVNPLVNVVSFCQSHVIPHLQANAVDQPVLKADCLKFIVTFRAQLPKSVIIESFPAVIQQLDSANTVVHTYAAHCIERIFTTRDIVSGLFSVSPVEMITFLDPVHNLLAHLLAPRFLGGPDAENPDGRLDENEYTMKCVMRTLSYFQQHILPRMDSIVEGLRVRIFYAIKNPGNPRYDHYLFESFALCIAIGCTANAQAVAIFEDNLFPAATIVLQNNVEAFFPYIFQLLALLLEHRSGEIPSAYMVLLDPLLNPGLLENESHIPSIVRLLGAYFEANALQITSRLLQYFEAGKCGLQNTCYLPGSLPHLLCNAKNSILGLFQLLIHRKKHDHDGFNLLRPLIDKTPIEPLRPFLTPIFTEFFKRLTASKTEKFLRNLTPVLYFFIVRHGPAIFIQHVDQVQKGIFGMVMEKIMLPEVVKVNRVLTRKMCIVGATELLTETPELFSGHYSYLWPELLHTIIKLIQLPPEKEQSEDIHLFDLSNDEPGTNLPTQATTQNQLVFARKPDRDPVADKPDVKLYLVGKLANLAQANPGMVRTKLSKCIPDVQRMIEIYCQEAKVTIS